MPTIKVIELVGTSPSSWEAATAAAVAEASKTVRNISGIEVMAQTATVKDGKIGEYRANVKVAFVFDG